LFDNFFLKDGTLTNQAPVDRVPKHLTCELHIKHLTFALTVQRVAKIHLYLFALFVNETFTAMLSEGGGDAE